jgi:hypothetical protein
MRGSRGEVSYLWARLDIIAKNHRLAKRRMVGMDQL